MNSRNGKQKEEKRDGVDAARNSLDYFVGGVPALGYFELQSRKLEELVLSSKDEKLTRLNLAAEVSFIGLASYFEAFCKNHFASLVNICPEILKSFSERRRNSTVSLSHIVTVRAELGFQLGNVIAEEYDFGSAKDINGLYQDLMRISPFSAKEAKRYSQFLSDRNLLVHHGGVFTHGYSSQRFGKRVAPGLLHLDSLIIGKKEFQDWESFIVEMATKIATISQSALEEFIARRKLTMNPHQKSAIRMLGSSR